MGVGLEKSRDEWRRDYSGHGSIVRDYGSIVILLWYGFLFMELMSAPTYRICVFC